MFFFENFPDKGRVFMKYLTFFDKCVTEKDGNNIKPAVGEHYVSQLNIQLENKFYKT